MKVVGELHVHTRMSDGEPSPAEVVGAAREQGLDFLAVTDHNTFEGALRALEFAKEKGWERPLIVLGNEVRTSWGDVLLYCPELPAGTPPRDPGELVDYAVDNNCALVPAHPFDPLRNGVGERLVFFKKASLSIECYNAGSLGWFNSKAVRLAAAEGFSCTAGSDAHILDYIGVYRSVVDAYDMQGSVEGIVIAIVRGRVEPLLGKVTLGMVVKRLFWGAARRLGVG